MNIKRLMLGTLAKTLDMLLHVKQDKLITFNLFKIMLMSFSLKLQHNYFNYWHGHI